MCFNYFSPYQVPKHQNASKARHLKKREQRSPPKKKHILSVFELVRYQNANMHANHSIRGNEKAL